jgi:hypothetical protein
MQLPTIYKLKSTRHVCAVDYAVARGWGCSER